MLRLATASLIALIAVGASATAGELALVTDLDLGEVESQAFALDTAQEIRVEGVALAGRHDRRYSDVWILDSHSRKVVWSLAQADLARPRRTMARFGESVSLPAGEYELYLTSFPAWSNGDLDGFDIGRLIHDLLDHGRDHDDLEDNVRRAEVRVLGEGRRLGENTLDRVRGRLADSAVVAFTGVGDNAYLRRGFELGSDADVDVYAIGEVTREGTYDTAWIAEADSGSRVWQLDYRDSEPAGGARKNRMAHEVLHLPAGRYVAGYASDDSHSYPRFNAPPPHDPMAWGLVVRVSDKNIGVTTFEPVDALARNVIVALTQVPDDAHRSQGFTLLRPMRVRVVALGEGTGEDMADYGWIINAATHEPVWRMRYRDTEHAGGARKNRVADEIVSLERGSYVVYYVTDGSHAFGDWNAAPPLERDRWGITVLAISPELGPADVKPYGQVEDPDLLARIDRVGDDEHRTAEFAVDRAADVVVYALGEGRRGRMDDYAWIEDQASGRTVWEMAYGDTEHAGGAEKNRMFRGAVHLPAGRYRLHYESDGSHSYEDWNASPPYDPESWGVTVSRR